MITPTFEEKALTMSRRKRHSAGIAAVVVLFAATLTITTMSGAALAAVVQTLTASVTGSGSVTVSWDQPSGAGANDYSYTVYFRAGSSGGYTTRQVAAGTESTVLSGLDGGQSYEIRVTSTPTSGIDTGREGCNTGGGACTAFASSASTSVTAATAPTAPTVTGVTAGNGQVSVAFSGGATNGASVSQYTASCGGLSATGTSSPVVVTGLTNGVARTCTVTTGSNIGDSAASAASSSVTPSTTPDTMDAPTVSGGNTSVNVTWTAVTATASINGADPSVVDDGGSAVTGYTVRIVLSSDSSEVTTSSPTASASSATVSGLTNGTAYKAQIRATNANGDGTYSSLSIEFTPSAGGGTPSLTMSTQPGAVTSGSAFSGASRPVVDVGTAGVVVTAAVVSGATVSGTTTATSDGSGLAAFSNLVVTRSSTGSVQLRFTATGYNAVTSSAFTVTVPGGGDSGSGTATTTTTTLPRSATTTTLLPRMTNPRGTTVIVVPVRFGAKVPALPRPVARVADDATVAVKPKTLTVLLDPPAAKPAMAVARYVITVTPVAGGRPVSRTIIVRGSRVVNQSFGGLSGRYRVSVSAVNRQGRVVGTWKTNPITVK